MRKLTTTERAFLSLLEKKSPLWLYTRVRPRGDGCMWIDERRFIDTVARKLVRAGLVVERLTFEGEPTERAHYSLTKEGRSALASGAEGRN